MVSSISCAFMVCWSSTGFINVCQCWDELCCVCPPLILLYAVLYRAAV